MSITSRKCDRCGAEIKDTDWDGKYGLTVAPVRYSLNGSRAPFQSFDLCLNCRDQLREWFEEDTAK